MASLAFIATFFVSKQIFSMTIYTCWPPDATSALVVRGAALGLRVRVHRQLDSAPPPPARPAPSRREGVLLDTACEHAGRILNEASASHAFAHHYSWLLLHEAPNSSLELLDAVEMLPDSDVTWLAPGEVLDVYRVKRDQPLIVTPLQMTSNDSLDKLRRMWSERLPTARRRQNLRNVSLSSALVITEPENFKGWSDLTDRETDTFPKFTHPLMILLAEDLNYRANMHQAHLYGARRAEDGSFSGLAGALQRRTVVVGAASLFMRADRWQVMDFVAETCELRAAFIFRQPSQSSVSNVFLLPFSRGVWAACGGVLALTAALLAALARALRAHHPDLLVLTGAEAVTFAIGTICQQGSQVTTAARPVRLVMFSALVCSLFAFTAYGAKIVSILQAPSAALQTIDDLERSRLALVVQNTTYRRLFFAESSEPATQRLYRHKVLPFGDAVFMTAAEGVARMRTGLYAFQVEQSAGYDEISQTFTEAEKCGLKELQAYRLPMVAVPLARHSGYRELFATRLRWQREAGLMSRARRVWLSEKPRCVAADAAGFLSVRLADVQPALQILWGGAGLSVLLLGAERALHALGARVARTQ